MRIDDNSIVWETVAKKAQERIDALRVENDEDLNERDTAAIRGGIAELLALLEWPYEGMNRPEIEPAPDYSS